MNKKAIFIISHLLSYMESQHEEESYLLQWHGDENEILLRHIME
jgi:hypothetical protein